MSGLEAVASIASIAQVVQYAVKLIAILQDISGSDVHSAKRYRRHMIQVQQVIQIAEIIRVTEGLQSALIQSHLLSLAETTKSIEEAIDRILFFAGPANKLQKCKKVPDILKADSAILQGFEDLERDKSCLALCLLGNFGSQIVCIQSNVKQIPHLQGQLGDIQKSLQDCTKIAAEGRRIQENTVVSSEHGFCFSCGSEERHMHEPVSEDLVHIGACAVQADALPVNKRRDSEATETSPCTLVGEEAAEEINSYSGEGIYDGTSGEHGWDDGSCTYSRITACDQASQINGSYGFSPSEGPRGHSSWFSIRATDKSNQWNGDIKDANVLVGFFSPRGP